MFAAGSVAVALAIGFSGCTNGGTKQEQRETQLVSLEAANTAGSSPWMDSTTSPDLPRRLNRVEDTSTADTRTVSGDQVGLYGGSTNQAVCDRDKMVNFLERNPVQGAAGRTVAGVSDIRAFASTLSPVVLLHDTRVTNHGFKNGTPTTFQSVLQTGTAVLVDNRGIPRVRCDSGVHSVSHKGWTFPVAPVKRYVNHTAVGAGGHVAVDTAGGVELSAPGQNPVHETVDVDSDALYPIFVADVAAN